MEKVMKPKKACHICGAQPIAHTVCSDCLENNTVFFCSVCGKISIAGQCCGSNTQEPMNDLAYEEIKGKKD